MGLAALTLVALTPAGALATGGEPGGTSSAAEAAAESPGATTESPGSTGWTPVEGGSEGTGEGSPPVQQGSSLGSGGGSQPAGSGSSGQTHSEPAESTAPQPVAPPPEVPSSTAGSGGRVEPESSTSAPVSPPPARKPTPAAAPSPVKKIVKVDLGSATAVARPPAPRAVDASATSPSPVVPATGSPVSATSGSDVLPLLALIAAALVLVYTAVRLVLHVRRRRAERLWEQVCSEREADWEETLRRINRTGAPVGPETGRQTATSGGVWTQRT